MKIKNKEENKNVKRTKRYLLLNSSIWTLPSTHIQFSSSSSSSSLYNFHLLSSWVLEGRRFSRFSADCVVSSDTLWWNLEIFIVYLFFLFINNTCCIPLSLWQTDSHSKYEEKGFLWLIKVALRYQMIWKGKVKSQKFPCFDLFAGTSLESHKRDGRCVSASLL